MFDFGVGYMWTSVKGEFDIDFDFFMPVKVFSGKGTRIDLKED